MRAALRAVFDAAVEAADPRRVVAAHLPDPPKSGRVVVVGAGKAAAAMAAALEEAWPDVPLAGAVVTRYGHAVPTRRIEVMEAAHPLPDANSGRAAERMLELVRGLTRDDLVIALLSGGGSALLAKPACGLTLADQQAVNTALLASGATIHEMNAVRKHLSAIKGGRLALAAKPAHVVTLAISDVPGDDPSIIASGPTIADPSTIADVRAIARRYRIDLPATMEETPKPGETDEDFRLVATPSQALAAATAFARERGFDAVDLGIRGGESRALGVEIARSAKLSKPGTMLLSGGETVVTLGADEPHGRGGRNLEFLLALAIALDGAENIYAIAGDTDGRDGYEDAAGAFVAPGTLARMRKAGIDPQRALDRHDSYTAFAATGDLLVTGPTLTNVNALRAVAVAPA
ncbi:MAG TPA: glycerate kinase [Candidatus Acidoferrales bacterium]|nr:glycerate kinase [Candidatus Acidoferrales bacterium]